MNQNKNIMKVAAISQEDLESINGIQSEIKTTDNREIILIAYEK